MIDIKSKPPQQPLVFYKMDQSGYLLNEADIKNIKRPWSNVMDDIKETLTKYIGPNLHSLYVRADFTLAKPIKKPEGFWLLIVVNKKDDIEWLDEYKDYLMGKYPFIKNFLFEIRLYEQIMLNYGYKFYIKTESACIYGDNIANKVEKIRPDSKLFFKSVRFVDEMGIWYPMINKYRDTPQIIQKMSGVISTLMLKASFELCIDREKKYTNDLYTCYRVFSKYYPDKEHLMRRAYYYTFEPTSDPDELLDLLNNLGKWLIAIFKLNIVEWDLKKK
jgi:hypothetical protein